MKRMIAPALQTGKAQLTFPWPPEPSDLGWDIALARRPTVVPITKIAGVGTLPRDPVAKHKVLSEQTTDSHEVELKRDAQQRGWLIYKVCPGKGQSEMKTKRPGLDALVGACKRRKVEVERVWKFDRFARLVAT